MNPAFLSEKEGKRPPRLNHLEKMIQLCAEVSVLNALLKNNPSLGRNLRHKGKIVKQNKIDPLTQNHLLTHSWGVGVNCFRNIKK